MLPPLWLLALVCGVTLLALGIERFERHRRRNALRRLAAQWEMSYTAVDLFRLSSRIWSNFPIAGAADLRVMDLIYASGGGDHRYVFTVEFAPDAFAAHRRTRRVGTASEPREHAPDAALSAPVLAPEHLSLVEQYEYLKSHNWQT